MELVEAGRLVVAVGGDESDVQMLLIEGEPWSKARPRHTRNGRTYQKEDDRAAEMRTRNIFADKLLQPMTGNVALAAIFYRSSLHRIDADNMLKHVCDSANGVAWHDDSQVTAIVGVVELDRERPRTLIALAPHTSTMTRGTDWTKVCIRCGDTFVVNPKYTMRKHCGDECAGNRGALAEPVPCAYCGKPFRRRTTAQALCSETCRHDDRNGRRRASAKPLSQCSTCGVQLDHRRGGRCRACWKTSPKG